MTRADREFPVDAMTHHEESATSECHQCGQATTGGGELMNTKVTAKIWKGEEADRWGYTMFQDGVEKYKSAAVFGKDTLTGSFYWDGTEWEIEDDPCTEGEAN